jgi:hypothetical protein
MPLRSPTAGAPAVTRNRLTAISRLSNSTFSLVASMTRAMRKCSRKERSHAERNAARRVSGLDNQPSPLPSPLARLALSLQARTTSFPGFASRRVGHHLTPERAEHPNFFWSKISARRRSATINGESTAAITPPTTKPQIGSTSIGLSVRPICVDAERRRGNAAKWMG